MSLLDWNANEVESELEMKDMKNDPMSDVMFSIVQSLSLEKPLFIPFSSNRTLCKAAVIIIYVLSLLQSKALHRRSKKKEKVLFIQTTNKGPAILCDDP